MGIPCSMPGKAVLSMKKELAEYLRGERSAVKDEFILSRQKITGGVAEMISVLSPGIQEPIYVSWLNPNKRKKYRAVNQEGTEADIRVVKTRPKGTGGKEPYVMLMESKTQNPDPLPEKEAAFLFNLIYCGCVEWHTGRVVRKRDGKRMTIAMLSKKFSIGTVKLKHIISGLTAKGVMSYNKAQRAYFISRKFARKGSSKSADGPGSQPGPFLCTFLIDLIFPAISKPGKAFG